MWRRHISSASLSPRTAPFGPGAAETKASWDTATRRSSCCPRRSRPLQLLPKKIEAFAGQRVVAVSAGGEHSLALTADGAVWSWGNGACSKLGHGDQQHQLLPKKVEALAGQRVVAVSAGAFCSLAATADGAIWSWGHGGQGRLGHGDEQNQPLPKKVEAFADQRVLAVSAGIDHSIARTADGAVWSWGNGVQGQLGHGDQQRQLLPKKIEAFAGQRVVAVAPGYFHSLALTADGALELGRWRLGPAGPRRPAEPAAAQEDRGAVAGVRGGRGGLG